MAATELKNGNDRNLNAVLIPVDARYLEHAVCLGTTLLIGSCCRGQVSEEETYSYLEILLINLFAVLVEERIADASPVYGQRRAMSSGLAIGSLLLPWVLYTQGGCHTMALSSFGVLLFLGMMLPWVSGREKQQRIPDELIFLCGLVLYVYLLFFHSDSRVYDALVSLLCITCFHGIMQYAPFTFTLGEGVALSSGSVHVVLELWRIMLGDRVAYTSPIALCIVSVVGMSLILFLSSVLVHQLMMQRRGISWTVHGAACIVGGIVVYHYHYEAVAWFIEHILYDKNRRKIIIFWVATLSVSLPFMMMLGRRDTPLVLPHTMVRKGFHALALILFIPSLVLDSGLLGMALSIALAAFMALEIIRISHVPYVSRYVHSCMSAFVDSRDGGVFYVTHMTLLLGLALPIWISQPWDDPYARFASLAGIMATGIGDAMASIVGTLYGKTKIAYNCNKTLEGSFAGIVSIVFSWLLAYVFILPPGTPHGPMDITWLIFATIASSFLESITDQFDNLFSARPLTRCSLEPRVVERLEYYDIYTVKDLFARTLWDLKEILDISLDDVQILLGAVGTLIAPKPVTARALLEGPAGHLRTLIDPLDGVLGGGIEAGRVTEIVGPAGLGKTQFCLGMCVMGCLDRLDTQGKVLYIDTEKKFSGERLSEIGMSRFPESFAEKGAIEEMLRRVIVQVPTSSHNLLDILQGLQSAIISLNIVLIVIDSIASLARAEFGGNSIWDRQKLLGQQASALKSLAESFHIPVLVTNQITTQFKDGKSTLVAALGPMWAHAVNTRLELTATQSDKGPGRSLLVTKSSSAPVVEIPYRVTRKGLELDVSISSPAVLEDYNSCVGERGLIGTL